jgi:hypothetical protein
VAYLMRKGLIDGARGRRTGILHDRVMDCAYDTLSVTR